MSEGSKAIFQRYFDEVTNKGNLGLVDEIFAADYAHHDPANPDRGDRWRRATSSSI